jgi:hypothetical protein
MFMTQAGDRYSRVVVFLTVLFYGVLTYPVRLLWKWHLHKKMEDGRGNTLLLLTSEEDAPSLIREIKTNNYASHRIIGVVVSEPEPVEQTIEGVSDCRDGRYHDRVCDAQLGR